MTGDVALRCAACAAPLLADDRFCEECGARVDGAPASPQGDASAGAGAAPEGCRACGAGAGAIGADGYCVLCGVLRPVPAAHDELDLDVAAAVTEQGRAHRRNEDAFDLRRAGADGVAAVICDGISTALSGHLAAQAAARAVGAVLAGALGEGADPDALAQATRAAAGAARDAVERVPWTTRSDLALPSCTLVCAACRADAVVLGWVGDSRAYWLAPGDARRLTVDDSWATEQVAEGLLSAEQAAADRRAHALTRWVGADAPDDGPQVLTFRPPAPGRLVLCSDGLWNYAPAPGDLAALLDELDAQAPPAAVARHLAAAAMARGGRDDVTIAVIDVRPEGTPAP